jgi:hypothetical protein
MNPTASNLWISSLIALRFSSSKRRSHCIIGLEPARISKECSVTSLEMPGMFEGLHANMSLFAQRKSTSTTSYLGSRVVPTRTVLLLEPLGSRGSSLTPSAGSKDQLSLRTAGPLGRSRKLCSWVWHFCPRVPFPPRRGWVFLPLGPSKSLLAHGISKDFISISLTHLFHKEEGWATLRLP